MRQSNYNPNGQSSSSPSPTVGSAAVAVAAALSAAAAASNMAAMPPMSRTSTGGHHYISPQMSRTSTIGGGGGGNSSIRGPYFMKLLVPERLAGVIIGKGGSGITELESETGSQMRLSGNRVYFPGTTDRVMVVGGEYENLEKIIPILLMKLNPQTETGVSDSAIGYMFRLVVTNSACACIIGKGGETIRGLCQSTGSIIRATDRIDNPPSYERIVDIKSQTAQSVIQAVREIVLDLIAQDMSFKEFAGVLKYSPSIGVVVQKSSTDLPGGGGGSQLQSAYHYSTSGSPAQNLVAAAGAAGAAAAASSIRYPHSVGVSAMVDQYPITIEFTVPSHSVGAIIGKNGESRNRIVHTTGANLVVSDRTTDPLADRKISISGPLAAVQAALSLVARHIVESQ